MMLRLTLVAALLAMVATPVFGGGPPQVVTQTVMVPQVTYKTITVPGVVCKPEPRQVTVNVCRMVPETHLVNCMKTVVTPQTRTWTQNYTDCRMTFEDVPRQVTVMVPHREQKQGMRTVCKPVATQVMQTVCKDLGSYQARSYVDCYGCTQTCQVWVPNLVTEQVPVTVWKPNYVEEPFTYDQIVCRAEPRQVVERVCKPVYEMKSRQMSCVVPVCQQVPAQVPVTTFKPVTEQKVINFTAMVPTPVTRQVTVPVCTMVPKTITCTLPGCCP